MRRTCCPDRAWNRLAGDKLVRAAEHAGHPRRAGPREHERDVLERHAHRSVVEVARDTGAIRILRYAVAHDCGTVINPMIVAGQVHGGVAQGIGGALYEEFAATKRASA